MVYTIEDLRNGKCAVKNDGTLEELQKVLNLAFPNDGYKVRGFNVYYFKSSNNNNKWTSGYNNITLPKVSVKEFFKQINNKKMNELKITKEKVLEAAAKCSTAKATLETLFPEAFEDQKYFDLSKLNKVRILDDDGCKRAGFKNSEVLQVRVGGNLKSKGFYLDSDYNWEIVKDNESEIVLLPTKKS